MSGKVIAYDKDWFMKVGTGQPYTHYEQKTSQPRGSRLEASVGSKPSRSSKRKERARSLSDLSELLTVKEAADYLRIHGDTVYQYIYAGVIKPVRIGPTKRMIRISVAALEELVNHAV